MRFSRVRVHHFPATVQQKQTHLMPRICIFLPITDERAVAWFSHGRTYYNLIWLRDKARERSRARGSMCARAVAAVVALLWERLLCWVQLPATCSPPTPDTPGGQISLILMSGDRRPSPWGCCAGGRDAHVRAGSINVWMHADASLCIEHVRVCVRC